MHAAAHTEESSPNTVLLACWPKGNSPYTIIEEETSNELHNYVIYGNANMPYFTIEGTQDLSATIPKANGMVNANVSEITYFGSNKEKVTNPICSLISAGVGGCKQKRKDCFKRTLT